MDRGAHGAPGHLLVNSHLASLHCPIEGRQDRDRGRPQGTLAERLSAAERKTSHPFEKPLMHRRALLATLTAKILHQAFNDVLVVSLGKYVY